MQYSRSKFFIVIMHLYSSVCSSLIWVTSDILLSLTCNLEHNIINFSSRKTFKESSLLCSIHGQITAIWFAFMFCSDYVAVFLICFFCSILQVLQVLFLYCTYTLSFAVLLGMLVNEINELYFSFGSKGMTKARHACTHSVPKYFFYRISAWKIAAANQKLYGFSDSDDEDDDEWVWCDVTQGWVPHAWEFMAEMFSLCIIPHNACMHVLRVLMIAPWCYWNDELFVNATSVHDSSTRALSIIYRLGCIIWLQQLQLLELRDLRGLIIYPHLHPVLVL